MKRNIYTKEELRTIILSLQDNKKELFYFNDRYDYSSILDLSYLFVNCNELIEFPNLITNESAAKNNIIVNCNSLSRESMLNVINLVCQDKNSKLFNTNIIDNLDVFCDNCLQTMIKS